MKIFGPYKGSKQNGGRPIYVFKRKKKEPPEPTTVPSRGVGAEEPALRRRTPEGHRKRGASPMSVAKKKQKLIQKYKIM